MGGVEETLPPGVGVRYEFVTGDGDRIGVLVHHGGRRDLFAGQPDDPDVCETFARLDVDDARTLADLLGVPHIGEQLDAVQHEILARVSSRFALSPIPLYLLAGLAVGEQGPVHIDVSHAFVSTGAEIGVVMLLLALGLRFTAEELQAGLRSGLPAGIFDAAANFTPGFAAGLLLGWGTVGALLLGGVTYISSSGIISKLLGDLGRLSNRETPVILTVLVFEDLVMAVFLPVVALVATGAALSGSGLVKTLGSLGAVALALFVALRHGRRVSRVVQHSSDEVLLLSLVGLACVVAGIAEGAGEGLACGDGVGAGLGQVEPHREVDGRRHGRQGLLPARDEVAEPVGVGDAVVPLLMNL